MDKIDDPTIDFEPISEEKLGLIEGCLKDEEYMRLHTETIRRLIKTCRYLYGEFSLSQHPKVRECLIKEGLAFPLTSDELELFEKHHDTT